jgi:N-acetylglutamate synthase-like GNAT family acetyltransferase
MSDGSSIGLREATIEDVPVLEALIAESARVLCAADYTEAQIEAAIGTAWGVDTKLIQDATYFVAEVGGEIVACGGWSQRATLFGSDHQVGRQSLRLDPVHDAARIRAFFVRPGWERQGIGRTLLEKCEAEARLHGFASAELVATLPGHAYIRRWATRANSASTTRSPTG